MSLGDECSELEVDDECVGLSSGVDRRGIMDVGSWAMKMKSCSRTKRSHGVFLLTNGICCGIEARGDVV